MKAAGITPSGLEELFLRTESTRGIYCVAGDDHL
jgi:hypothetical protein